MSTGIATCRECGETFGVGSAAAIYRLPRHRTAGNKVCPNTEYEPVTIEPRPMMSDLLRWQLYEELINGLTPAEALYELEELTMNMALGEARSGDYHRQMLVKRVLLRKLGHTPPEDKP